MDSAAGMADLIFLLFVSRENPLMPLVFEEEAGMVGTAGWLLALAGPFPYLIGY